MTVVSFFCLFISLVLSTPYCFGAEPNHENSLENCTDALNYPITFENWDEFIHQNLNSCILVLSTPCCFGSKPNHEKQVGAQSCLFPLSVNNVNKQSPRRRTSPVNRLTTMQLRLAKTGLIRDITSVPMS